MVDPAMEESKSREEKFPSLGGARRASGGPGPTAEDEAYEIRIARDGTWYYHGSPIGRIALCKLFSTVLRRDERGDYWLITPAERGRITVEDAPFVAVEVTADGEGQDQRLTFRTNLDHEVTAGPDHPIRVETDPGTGEPSPYVLVRDNLEARINRATFYHLVERGEEQAGPEGTEFGVWSGGCFFPLGRLPA
ncbi:DUF1285 domain-containing protein [Indioceanicola profundi]|uniref:DUF1285 domain-containing protein n=1 Tax=Indioceanicola profundi TaxID=2220096 RepID=UPI001CED2A83|nr:DUF1285 domain-containing protein [Indioceanicola profundi]